MKTHTSNPHSPAGRALAWFLAAVLMLSQCAPAVFALPSGEQVRNGDVSFKRSGNMLTVEQASGKAIVNYGSFDIGASETVQFIQPGSSAAILNRVTGGGGSTIAGALLANGQVYLVNPNGILFSSSARVNVGALVASAMPMSDGDFLSGRLFFSGGGGSVVNEGNLSGKYVYLIGSTVENRGSISAGSIALAAGQESVLIDRAAGGEIRLVIDGLEDVLAGDLGDEPAGTSAFSDRDEIAASGDATEAKSGGGTAPAESAETVAREIGSTYDAGTVLNEGLLDATGETGGEITLSGLRAGQAGAAHADGTVGNGGSIRILGHETVALGPESLTTANAGLDGDGGDILVIAEGTTHFLPGARIEARGGSRSGDGGYVEVSGRETMTFGGAVDVTAPAGETGTAYFDPTTLTLIDALAGGALDGSLPNIFEGLLDVIPNTVSWGAIDALAASANVILEASTLVTVADVTGAAGGGVTSADLVELDLNNAGSLTIRSVSGAVVFQDQNDTIRTEGGSISVIAGTDATLGSLDTTGSAANRQGEITVTAGGTANLRGLSSGGDNVTVSGADLTGLGAVDAGATGAAEFTFTGDIAPADLDITAASILLHAGTDGSGNLQFAGTPSLAADDIALRAGDGAGNTAAILGAPTAAFSDTAGAAAPAVFSMRQDADLSDASIPDATAFTGGSVAGVDYTLQSDGGTVTIDDGTKVADSDLTLTGGGATGVDVNDTLNVNSLAVSGAAQVGGDLVSATDITLNDATTFDGAAAQVVDAVGGTLTANAALQKTTPGDLTLAGDTLVDLNGNVAVSDGALLLPDGADAAGDLVSSADFTLDNTITLDGAGAQRIDSTAGALTVDDVSKPNGDLILAGATNVDLNVLVNVPGGSLVIEDPFTASDDLRASADVTLNGVAVLDGAGSQVIDAQGGTLTANAAISKAAGDLDLGGGTDIDLSDNVTVASGDLTVLDKFSTAGDLVAGNNITLQGAASFDGAGDQLVDAQAGTLETQDTVSKSTAGNLTLAGGTLVDLNANVLVLDGGLLLPDGAEAAANLVSSADLVLDGAVVLDGAGLQRVDSTAGALTVNGVDKANGNLILAGATGITINAMVDLPGGSLVIEDDFSAASDILADQDVTLFGAGTFVGTGDQAVEAVSGTLTANDTLRKTSAGDLFLAAGTLVDLNGDVQADDGSIQLPTGANLAGDLTASGDVNLDSTIVLDGAGAQRIESTTGTLTANDAVTKAAGDLALAGGAGIDLNALVDLDGGSLTIEDDFATSDDLIASADVTLQGAGTFDGAGSQLVRAETGTLTANDTLTKTATGDLVLRGGTLVDLNANVQVDDGTLQLPDGAQAAADLAVSGDFTLDNTVVLDGAGVQRVDSTAGTLTVLGVNKAAGTAVLAGDTAVDINAAIALGNVNLTVEDDFTAAADITSAGGTITLQGAGTFDGAGNQAVDAGTGSLVADSTLTKTTAGNLTLAGDTLVDLNDDVNVNNGGLILPDGANAAGDLVSSDAFTADNTIVLDGVGAQRLDSTAGQLTVNSINKAAGDLVLGGALGIDINVTVDLDDGSLTIEDPFNAAGSLIASQDVTLQGAGILDGATGQRIDAETGTLQADQSLTKTGAGTLTLAAGSGANLDGNVGVNAGSLVIEDDFSAAGNLIGSGDVALLGAGTLDGAGLQRIDAVSGSLIVDDTITKPVGNLDLGGTVMLDLNDTVETTAGSLVVEDDFNAARDLIAGQDLTLLGPGTLDGAIDQRIDAQAGTLTAGALTKTGAGTLTLGGGTAVDLNGPVNAAAGSLVVEDPFTASGNLTASQDVTLQGAGTLDGAVAQRVDAVAGTLSAEQTLTKTGAGNLLLGGGTDINLDDTVSVNAGSLVVEDDFSAADDLIASQDVTLQGAGTLDGAGAQRIDAQAGVLSNFGTLSKPVGDLVLAGGAGIDLNASVEAGAGSVTIEDTFTSSGDVTAGQDVNLLAQGTLDGAADQRIDAEGGTLTTPGLNKTGAGTLILGGGTAIDLNGLVDVDAGSLVVEDAFTSDNNLLASQDVTLEGDATLDGAGAQRIDAEGGVLTADGRIDKPVGTLNLAGASGIDLNDAVNAAAGSLVVEDAFAAAGDLTAGQDVTLQGIGTLDGVGAQRVDAQAGTLAVNAALTKTGAGTLTLGGAAALDLNARVDVDAGSLVVEDAFTSDNDLVASQNVTLQAAGTLDGAAGQRIDAEAGTLTANGPLTKAAGDLVLGGGTLVDLNALVDLDGGSLTIEDDAQANNNLVASQNVTLQGNTVLDGAALQRLDAEAGILRADGTITKGAGDLVLAGATGVDLNDTVDLNGGSLLIEDPFTAAGDLTASQDITLPVAGTLDGAADQRVDAEAGTLLVQALLNKTGAGDLALGGGTAIDLNAPVDVDAGSLTVEDAFTASADLTASQDVTLQGQGTYDGAGAQTVEAESGTLSVQAAQQKPAGNLNLSGGGGVDLNDSVDVPAGNLHLASAAGSVRQLGGQLSSPTLTFDAFDGVDLSQAGNLWDTVAGTAGGNVLIVDADALEVGAANGFAGLESTGGGIEVRAAAGALTIVQAITADGNVCLKATDDVLLMAHVTAGNDVGIWADTDADDVGDVQQTAGTVTAQQGDLFVAGYEVSQAGASQLAAPDGTVIVNANENSIVTLGSTLIGIDAANVVIGAGTILVGTEVNAAGGTAILRAFTGVIAHNTMDPNAKVVARSIGLLGATGVGAQNNFFRVDSDFLSTGTALGSADVFIEEVGATTAARGVLLITDPDFYPSQGPDCAIDIPRPFDSLDDIIADFGGIQADNDLNVIAEDIIGGVLVAGNNANIVVTGLVNLELLSVPGTANIQVGGDFTVDDIDIGTLAMLDVGGNASVGSFRVANNANIDIGGSFQVGTLDVGGNADVDVGSDMEADRIDVGGAFRGDRIGGNFRFNQLNAGNVEVDAGSIDMGRVNTGRADFNARGDIRDNNSEVNASSLTMTGGRIGAPNSPIVLNASRIDTVSGSRDVFIRQIRSGETPIGLLSAGGNLVVDVPNGGLVDANGDAVNIRSGGYSEFNLQFLGLPSDAIEVDIGDVLRLDGAGLSGDNEANKARIFANLEGTIAGSENGRRILYIGNVPIPGLVLFNGQILLGDEALLAEVFRSEAFIVETPEIKSPEGVFGGPYFIHLYMQISEAWNLFLDYILYGQALVNADPELPPEAKRTIQIGGGEKPYSR